MVLLSFPAANRDPDVFPDADKVLIDRKHNPPRRFRARHSSLHRLEPGADGNGGGAAGVAEAHSRVQP